MNGLLTQWSVTAVMRGIAGLSLVIFLSIIAMNYQAIGQVHDIEEEASRQAISFASHWHAVAQLGSETERIRLSYLLSPDGTGEERMRAVLTRLRERLAAQPNRLSDQAAAMAAAYAEHFGSLAQLMKKRQEFIARLVQDREALEVLIYEQGDAGMEAAVIDLEPGEMRYLAQPAEENAAIVKVTMDRLVRDASGNERETAIVKGVGQYRSGFEELVGLERQKVLLVTRMEESANQMFQLVQEVNRLGEREAQDVHQSNEARMDLSRREALTWTLVGVMVPILLISLFDRFFHQRITVLMRGIHQMARGDLSSAIAMNGRDEIALLAGAANDMRSHLHAIVVQVEGNAATVHGAAEEISVAADSQAATTSEISASVSQIGSTMEELSASSSQIAEYAQSVEQIANRTWENSKSGATAMRGLVARMSDIRADNQRSLEEIFTLGSKSKEISRIMEIIDDVADQTRLIAFNAALEASSAGESGRRFGVVAVEIRRLADSVTESTTEIAKKVGEIQNAISRLVLTSEKGAAGIVSGMGESSEAAARLEGLVEDAHQTNIAAEQIAISSQQQRIANSQVVIALREIVSGSLAAASSVDHISSIAQEMVKLSADLNGMVGQFRLDQAGGKT